MRSFLETQLRSLTTVVIVSSGGLAVAEGLPKDIDATVNQAAGSVMTQYEIPGMAIAITYGGHQRYYEFGVTSKATKQAVSRASLFEVGSVSKTLTATLAAYAQVQGRLSLTDSPGQHIAELNGTSLDQVSLINLATHTAGGFPMQLPERCRPSRS